MKVFNQLSIFLKSFWKFEKNFLFKKLISVLTQFLNLFFETFNSASKRVDSVLLRPFKILKWITSVPHSETYPMKNSRQLQIHLSRGFVKRICCKLYWLTRAGARNNTLNLCAVERRKKGKEKCLHFNLNGKSLNYYEKFSHKVKLRKRKIPFALALKKKLKRKKIFRFSSCQSLRFRCERIKMWQQLKARRKKDEARQGKERQRKHCMHARYFMSLSRYIKNVI